MQEDSGRGREEKGGGGGGSSAQAKLYVVLRPGNHIKQNEQFHIIEHHNKANFQEVLERHVQNLLHHMATYLPSSISATCHA